MKVINILLIVLCLATVKALDDSLYMYFDLEGIVPGYETRLTIMDKGYFNTEVSSFANNIAIPANVTRCKLIWFTTSPLGTTYKATVVGTPPEDLGVYLDVPTTGTVPTQETNFYIYFTCHRKGTHKMSLKLQFFNKAGTEEYEGFTISPSHISYDPCTSYPDTVIGTRRNAYTFSSFNFHPEEVSSIERFNAAYTSLSAESMVIAMQGISATLRDNITEEVYNVYKYRIPYPHLKDVEESVPLYVMSKNPIYTCNYIEFDNFHEYGAVVAGISMGTNRIAFIINAMFPELDEKNANTVINKVSETLEEAVTAFSTTHPNYNIDGYFLGDVNFDTELEISFLNKLNNTIGHIIGNNLPGEGLVLGYNKKTANTSLNSFERRIIGTKNYTSSEYGSFTGAVRYGALVTKIDWGKDASDPSDNAGNNIFNLICYLLVVLSILVIM